MKYIPTLNYMCTRSNVVLCAAIIDLCDKPRTRKELGKQFSDQVDSSKLSRLLFAMKRANVLEQNDNREWVIGTLIKYNVSGLPFRIVPVDGICAQILRLFGSQYSRRHRMRPKSSGFHDVKGPPAGMTIKSLMVVLRVSREVLQLRLTLLLELGLIQRKSEGRTFSYEICINKVAN